MSRAALPQRPQDWRGSRPAPHVDFAPQNIAAGAVAEDMSDLAARVRSLMDLQRGAPLKLPLGGALFDIVVTGSGPEAYAAVHLMDEVQRIPGARDDTRACGPVIEDPEHDRLIWLVPPGTRESWEPHRYATCLGAPYTLALPPLEQTEPPGPYWLRPCRGDRLVPAAPLADLLGRFQPGPIPHEELLGESLSTIS
ncbi:hypothetical protein [Streptomyces triticiradicis]|uniref:hypothetical protein n=1 Tax=Streptomyces triticiradicis TaxID=2651189 RepID=UPI001CECDCDE|nr:hypothetical protein [Streptomyces triticiradicis]